MHEISPGVTSECSNYHSGHRLNPISRAKCFCSPVHNSIKDRDECGRHLVPWNAHTHAHMNSWKLIPLRCYHCSFLSLSLSLSLPVSLYLFLSGSTKRKIMRCKPWKVDRRNFFKDWYAKNSWKNLVFREEICLKQKNYSKFSV